ncbi:MAG: hypothetical protein ACR2GA_06590 [Chloroflexota bacterium]
MTTQNNAPRTIGFTSQTGTPAQLQSVQAEIYAIDHPIAWIKVRLISLKPGESEIEWVILPTGPLGAASSDPMEPGYNRAAYMQAYQTFIAAVKRELDHDFARNEQGTG